MSNKKITRRTALEYIVMSLVVFARPLNLFGGKREYLSYVNATTEDITKYLENIYCLKTYAEYSFKKEKKNVLMCFSTATAYKKGHLWASKHAIYPHAYKEEKERKKEIPKKAKFNRYTHVLTRGASSKLEDNILVKPLRKFESLDLAILYTDHPFNYIPFKVGDSDGLKPGNFVYIISYPLVYINGYPPGFKKMVSGGMVSSTELTDENKLGNNIIINAAVNPGSSGSPVLATSKEGGSELVGIYHTSLKNAINMNLVIPINRVKKSLWK